MRGTLKREGWSLSKFDSEMFKGNLGSAKLKGEMGWNEREMRRDLTRTVLHKDQFDSVHVPDNSGIVIDLRLGKHGFVLGLADVFGVNAGQKKKKVIKVRR